MTRIYSILSVVVVVLLFGVTLAVYWQLPERVPVHWNIRGEVDGYGDKGWSTFLTPGILVGLLLLFWALPWLSPKHFTLESFLGVYWFIVFVVICTLSYVHSLLLWAAWSGRVDITRAMLIGLVIMFGLIGAVLGRVKRNFWVGVRTPWTMASERVWDATHSLAGRLFVGAAIIAGLTLVLPVPLPIAIVTLLVAIFGAALTPVVYSLVFYKQLERRGELS